MNSFSKWFTTVILAVFLLFPTVAYAGTSQNEVAVSAQMHSNADNTTMQHTLFFRGSSYHSGSKSSSSRVSGSRSGSSGYSSYGMGRSGFGSGFGSHLMSFGAGWFLGGMFHPFGGYYGSIYHSFSIFHFLIDLFIIWIIWRVIRRIFR